MKRLIVLLFCLTVKLNAADKDSLTVDSCRVKLKMLQDSTKAVNNKFEQIELKLKTKTK